MKKPVADPHHHAAGICAAMLALIIVVCLVAIDQLGDMSRNTFRNVSNQLSGS